MRHISQEYSNNRFVTRQYARFADEILANRELAREMTEKAHLQQRRINVNRDAVSRWGHTAFPNLPLHLFSDMQAIGELSPLTESDSVPPEEMQSMDQGAVLIEHRIEELSFPGVTRSIAVQILIFIVFMGVVTPVMLVLDTLFESQMLEPFEYLSTQSLMHTYGYILMSLGHLYAYTHIIGGSANPSRTPVPTPPPTSSVAPDEIGGGWDLSDQIAFWSRELTETLPKFLRFQSIVTTNANLEKARHLLFEPVTNLIFYDSSPPESMLVPVSVGYLSILKSVMSLAEKQVLQWTVLKSPNFLNPLANVPVLGPILLESLDNLVDYLRTVKDDLGLVSDIITFVSIGLCVVVAIVIQYLQSGWIDSNKISVYTTLLDLSKSQLSAMIEALRIGRVDPEESESVGKRNGESTKQDDTVMKTFVAVGSGTSSRSTEQIWISMAAFLEVAIFVGLAVVIHVTTVAALDRILQVAPHLTYIHSMWASAVAGTTYVYHMFFVNDSDWPSVIYDGKKDQLIAH
jgi:hypothetical protein